MSVKYHLLFVYQEVKVLKVLMKMTVGTKMVWVWHFSSNWQDDWLWLRHILERRVEKQAYLLDWVFDVQSSPIIRSGLYLQFHTHWCCHTFQTRDLKTEIAYLHNLEISFRESVCTFCMNILQTLSTLLVIIPPAGYTSSRSNVLCFQIYIFPSSPL